jgi:hypothetical protein
MRSGIAAAWAAFGVLAASPAFAACDFKVLPIPVTMVGMKPTVSVMIGGQERHFLLDSGSATNAISVGVAAEQKLLETRIWSGNGLVGYGTMTGAKGDKIRVSVVRIPEVGFLGTKFYRKEFTVVSLSDVDGLLGQPMLERMDVEYDLKGGVIRLVKTRDCQGTDMVYWAKSGQAYSKMTIEPPNRYNPHTQGFIYINGQKMLAAFDTGATSSFITADAAARAGVHMTDPGVTPIGKIPTLDGEVEAAVGKFADVKIGEEEIKDAPLEIGLTNAQTFDVLIGADFFASHHVYVSNEQHQIFFAYDGGPPFLPSKARPPTAPRLKPPQAAGSTLPPTALLPPKTSKSACPLGETSVVCDTFSGVSRHRD